LLSGDDLFLI
jgi:hypothetical protein